MEEAEAKLIDVGSLTDLVDRGRRVVTLVGAHEILAFAIGQDVHVVGNRCPHLIARLDEWGVVDAEELELTCRLHAWNFSLQTGEEQWDPCRKRLRLYEAVVRDGRVYTRLPLSEITDATA